MTLEMPILNLNQGHHLPETLGDAFGKGTTAQWAANPEGKAIIFVHGFQGEALDTWTDFPTLLTSDARLAGVDLLFYGYDGLYTQAGSSSLLFLQFLEQLFTDINSLIGKSLQPRNGFAYSTSSSPPILWAPSSHAARCSKRLEIAHHGSITCAWCSLPRLTRVRMRRISPLPT